MDAEYGLLNDEIINSWVIDIKKDFDNGVLINEDSLKCSFYYNLRRRIEKGLSNRNKLKLIPEFSLRKLNRRVDMAIIQTNNCKPTEQSFIYSVEALIEFKYIKKRNVANSTIKHFVDDLVKLADYYKLFSKSPKTPLLYAAFIHEYEYGYHHSGYLDGFINMEKEIITGITELIGYQYQGTSEFFCRGR